MGDSETEEIPISLVRANDYLEAELRRLLQAIEEVGDAHALSLYGPLYFGADDEVRDLIEHRIKHASSVKRRLIFLLTTSGGQLEPVQRIAELIHHHYEEVWFIIPNYAYSAGTILTMSGNRILMDYYGRLGPIDPQIPNQKGVLVPALGYLARWNQLLKRAEDKEITLPEIQVMMEFDQGDLYRYEQERERSIALLKEWLVNFKFRDWHVTEHNGRQVTLRLKKTRAVAIARRLSDPNIWHSHGHGISRGVLIKDVKLQIDDLSKEHDLYERVREYDHLLSDYIDVRGASLACHMLDRPLILQ